MRLLRSFAVAAALLCGSALFAAPPVPAGNRAGDKAVAKTPTGIVGSAAGKPKPQAFAGKTYTSKIYHYSVTLPGNWKRRQTQNSVIFTGPIDQGYKPNFVININDAGKEDLTQYVEEAKQAIRKMKTIKIQIDKATTLGGQPARALQLYGTLKNTQFLQRQVYCLHGSHGFVLGATTAPVMTDRYNSTFNKVFASFQWTK